MFFTWKWQEEHVKLDPVFQRVFTLIYIFFSGLDQTSISHQGWKPTNHNHLETLLDAIMGRRCSFICLKIVFSRRNSGPFSKRSLQICDDSRMAHFSGWYLISPGRIQFAQFARLFLINNTYYLISPGRN